ncbi:MAG TPA: PQQ-dependent sugar dehydrogenase [Gemmatimonadaceae bacterium]
MRTTRHWFTTTAVVVGALAACSKGENAGRDTTASGSANGNVAASCPRNDTQLKLASGFCATIFADSVGAARHLVVAPNGVVYVTLEGTKPSPEKQIGGQPQPPAPSAVVAMRDTTGDGKADVIERIPGTGNTGIGIYNNMLYVDEGTKIVRYAMDSTSIVPRGQPQTVVSGLPLSPGHRSRNFVIDRNGALYVNVGSATNACQAKDRAPDMPGTDPCTELRTRAGLWKFDANKTGQTFSPNARFVTGLRNGMGLAINPADGKLWATQHGRDGLFDYWKSKFPDPKYQAENPAEELVQANQNDDFGWPYCYYAVDQKKLVDAPEYGGDGKKDDRCKDKKEPVATFGGHWAPMDLFFYTGSQLPGKYRNGAFVVFHGSWNRAPEQQAPSRVVFQPLNGDKANGDMEIFIDDFAQVPADQVQPGTVKHRAVGIAQGPDGSLYISDDLGGRIYRVTYGAQNGRQQVAARR